MKIATTETDSKLYFQSVTKNTLLQLQWEILPCIAYSPDIASLESLPESLSQSLQKQHRPFDTVPEIWEHVVENDRKYIDYYIL